MQKTDSPTDLAGLVPRPAAAAAGRNAADAFSEALKRAGKPSFWCSNPGRLVASTVLYVTGPLSLLLALVVILLGSDSGQRLVFGSFVLPNLLAYIYLSQTALVPGSGLPVWQPLNTSSLCCACLDLCAKSTWASAVRARALESGRQLLVYDHRLMSIAADAQASFELAEREAAACRELHSS